MFTRITGFSSLAAVAVLVHGFASTQVSAATWYVDRNVANGDGTSWVTAFDTIVEGVDAASDGDNVLVADGTYIGSANRELIISGKAITIRSANGPVNCIIDCESVTWAFEIATTSGELTQIEGFTIRNAVSSFDGGAVLTGGSGTFRFTNCVFELNTSANYGGAIYNYGSTGAIVRCTFQDNVADKGGAVASNGGEVDVVNCAFVGNRAFSWAGALDGDAAHITTLVNCRFSGNLSYAGGAVSCGHYSELTFINCTISGNRATSHGGGINVDSSSVVTLANCALWDDEVQSDPPVGPELALGVVGSGTTGNVTYSDVKGGANDVYVDGGSTLNWGSGNINSDPAFVAQGAWDEQGTSGYWWDDTWTDGDYHLSIGSPSPCIDTSDNNAIVADEYDVDGDSDFDEPTPDLDAQVRIKRGALGFCIIDMGALEMPPACEGDVDDDGDVDVQDLANLLGCYGEPATGNCSASDLDCNGEIGLQDLSILLSNFGNICSGGMGAYGQSCVDEAFIDWARAATLEQLLEWYAEWSKQQ